MYTRYRFPASVLFFLCFCPSLFAQTSEDVLWVRGGGLNGRTIADLTRDGSRLVTGESEKGWIRLWEVETSRMIASFNPDMALRGDVRDLRFSRDGSQLAAVCHDSAVRLFDGYTGELLGVLPAPRSSLSVEFSLTGDTLLVGDEQGVVHFFELSSMSRIGRVELPIFSASGILMLPSGNRIAVIYGDSVLLVDSPAGESPVTLAASLDYPWLRGHSLSITMNGEHIFMRLKGERIGIFDVASGDSVGFIGVDAEAMDMAESGDTLFTFSPTGKIGQGSYKEEWSIRMWSIRTGAILDSAIISMPDIYRVDALWRMMPDRKSHVVVSSIRLAPAMPAPMTLVARQWFDGLAPERNFLLGHAPVTALRGIDNLRIGVAADKGGNYRLLDVETGEEIERVDYPGGGHRLSLSPDGVTRAVSSIVDENLQIHSRIDPGDRPFYYNTRYEDVPALWVDDGGDQVAYGHLVQIPGMYGKLLLTGEKGIDTVCDNALLSSHASVAFSFGSDPMLAASIRDSTVLLYETGSRSVRSAVSLPALAVALAFSRDGRLLACGRNDGIISLIDVGSGAMLGDLIGHVGLVADLQFCRNDRWLVSAGEDATVRTWEISTGENDYTYRQGSYGFVAVGATRDGKYVFAGGEDLSLVCWLGRGGISGIEETSDKAGNEKNGLTAAVHPNPIAGGEGGVVVEVPGGGRLKLEVLRPDGSVLFEQVRDAAVGRQRLELPTFSLPAGGYYCLLRLCADDGSVVRSRLLPFVVLQ